MWMLRDNHVRLLTMAGITLELFRGYSCKHPCQPLLSLVACQCKDYSRAAAFECEQVHVISAAGRSVASEGTSGGGAPASRSVVAGGVKLRHVAALGRRRELPHLQVGLDAAGRAATLGRGVVRGRWQPRRGMQKVQGQDARAAAALRCSDLR